MTTAFRWNRQCAVNFEWLREHDPRTGEKRLRVPSLARLADDLGYKTAKPMEKALQAAHWEVDMDHRPPLKWEQLGDVLGVVGLDGQTWRTTLGGFKVACWHLTKPPEKPAWWRRLGAWFVTTGVVRPWGFRNRRVRPTVTGPAGGKDMLK